MDAARHPAADLLPANECVVQLGPKSLRLRYTMRSKVVVEERHGSESRFMQDWFGAVSSDASFYRVGFTILLAGCAYMDADPGKGMTEHKLDALVGADEEAFVKAVETANSVMVDAFRWHRYFEASKAGDDSGEAPAAEAAEPDGTPTRGDDSTSTPEVNSA